MELADTLRYFYSAVFQGFAALISVGLFVFFFRMQQISNKMHSIENEILNLLQNSYAGAYSNYIKNYTNFYDYCCLLLQDKYEIATSFTEKIHDKVILYISLKLDQDTRMGKIKWTIISSSIVLIMSIIMLLFIDRMIYLSYLPALILLLFIFWAFWQIIKTMCLSIKSGFISSEWIKGEIKNILNGSGEK